MPHASHQFIFSRRCLFFLRCILDHLFSRSLRVRWFIKRNRLFPYLAVLWCRVSLTLLYFHENSVLVAETLDGGVDKSRPFNESTMAFPQSFSTTAECPFMDNSPSTLTVRLSTSCTPIAQSTSRFVSFSSELEPPIRPRAHTESDIVKQTPSSPPPVARVSSPKMTTSMSLSRTFSSRRQSYTFKPMLSNSISKPEMETSMSWFGRAYEFMRPWDDDGDGTVIPEEQKQVFVQTREAVSVTLRRLLKCSGKVALEGLIVGMEMMEYVPNPIVQGLAKTFLAIWKAVQQVSMNRLAMLRLTQTCSNILESICNEVEIAGDQVMQELSGPILVLEKSFESFLSLVESQVNAPFLARYLKRDETSKALASCNESMMRALTLFTNTVQIRTLAAVCANSKLQDAKYEELKATIEHAIKGSHSQTPLHIVEMRRCSAPELDSLPSSTSSSSLGISASPTIVSRSTDDLLPTPQVVPALQELQTLQNLHDHESDVEDLERTIKGVLNTGDDTKLLAFLGVKPSGMPEAIKTLQRTLESRSINKDDMDKDVLHQEFLECGVEALRRLSTAHGNNLAQNLPAWTITSLEIVCGKRIGIGSFSEVYQGTWKGRTVAVKFLSDVTPYDLFIREITVWKGLRHPNVLTLFGASSATDNPPWFFVSPYMENNTLVHFLKHLSRREEYEVHALGPIAEDLPYSKSRSSYGTAFLRILKAVDVYRILQQVARGMEYLHCKGILHGDLKGANILVDKQYRCVISDFGQSEMKSEVYRITGSSMQTGTLRWKAPELLDGSGMLTPATDVYAFAIVCIEVLTMGDIPWGQESDDAVRYHVLERDKRPTIPQDYPSPLLHDLIESCWVRNPDHRSPFGQVVARLDRLKQIAGDNSDPSVMAFDDLPSGSPIPSSPRPNSPTPTPHFDSVAVFGSIDDYIAVASTQEIGALQLEESATISNIQKLEAPAHYMHRTSIRSTKTSSSETHSRFDDDASSVYTIETTGPTSNDTAAGAMNERRYRYLLEHEYNASLTLPLWEPSLVQIGDVGYLRKPTGDFVTLFNALKAVRSPRGTTNSGFANMSEFGNISRGNIRTDKKTVTQKGLDVFSGFLSFRSKNSEQPIARRHSFRLRAGHKCAYMHIEGGDYMYMKRLDAPKAWFQANVERILSVYGQQHNIQKEDLLLVISLLQAPNYALFVSHNHPEGQLHFNVYAGLKKGRPWGNFTTHTSHSTSDPDRNGPSYDSEDPGLVKNKHENAVKVSKVGDPPKAILIGRLRFKPDGVEPTTSK